MNCIATTGILQRLINLQSFGTITEEKLSLYTVIPKKTFEIVKVRFIINATDEYKTLYEVLFVQNLQKIIE